MAGNQLGALAIAAGKVGLSLEEYVERRENGLKHCTKCKSWKPVGAFAKDSSRGDGRKAACLICGRVTTRRERIPTDTASAKQRAHDAIRIAVKGGLLPRPGTLKCTCGAPARHYHHHHGYGKPHVLDVIPLCISCHHKAHWKET